MKKEQKSQECKVWLKGDRENNLNYIRELLEGIHYIGMRKDFYGKYACLNSLITSVIVCVDELALDNKQVVAAHHEQKQHISFEEFAWQKLCMED